VRERSALLGRLRSCFARTQTWLVAGRYLNALVSDLPSRNGWSVGEHAGDQSPAKAQRLLNRACWDEQAAMSVVRCYAAAGLDAAARRSRRARMSVGALDETGQEKQGSATAGVKRQYMGCAGRAANGVNTVHLSYVREKTGHALAGARQWIPEEQVKDPVKSLVTGLPLDLRFRTKGQLAAGILSEAYADGLSFDYVCGDEVYGSCTELREFLEDRGQAYVLRRRLLPHAHAGRRHEDVLRGRGEQAPEGEEGLGGPRSAGQGSKGERWYAWAWLATASPGHSLLVRRHLKTGELAFHYCYVPEGQAASKARLIRAAGLRWPVEECFEFAKGLPRSGPVPGPPLHRGPAPPRARHGRPRRLRRHRRPAQDPHRHPGTPRLPARMPPRPPTPASSHCPSPRSGNCSPPRSPAPRHPDTPPTGSTGDAATRHDPAGSTNAHASHATTPWSASDCRLPY